MEAGLHNCRAARANCHNGAARRRRAVCSEAAHGNSQIAGKVWLTRQHIGSLRAVDSPATWLTKWGSLSETDTHFRSHYGSFAKNAGKSAKFRVHCSNTSAPWAAPFCVKLQWVMLLLTADT